MVDRAKPPELIEEPLTISSLRLPEWIAVAVAGELDLATSPIAEADLRRAEESHHRVVLDLRGVTFMDSTGLHLVLAANARMRERGGSLAVVPGQGQVRDLFKLAGLEGHVELIDDWDSSGSAGIVDELDRRSRVTKGVR